MQTPNRDQEQSPVKRALQAVERLQSQVQAAEYARREPIAVIGVACRFPGGVETPAAYWHLLRSGVDAISEVPPERWAPGAGQGGQRAPHYGGFMAGIDAFDAAFFGITPREARSLDPQQRLLLEVSWEALEQANLVPDELFASATGVFVGICTSDYHRLLLEDPQLRSDLYRITGHALSVAAGRVSYTLGLIGPSMAIDTACSSSLMTVHLACQSLRNRECNLALAGGVSLMLQGDTTETFLEAGMLAPDGRCKTFDASANGYVRGEGCGIVVLKRLSDALADGDTISAVIRGSTSNQDGRSSGLTAPSGSSQQAVIRQALANSRVEPAEVGYIEAHGTGTTLGDPIEIGALGAVFGQRTAPLWVGSVKTNIGHLEGAAGIASLIKVVLSLQHGEIPPHLHFRAPSPFIAWDGLPIKIPTAVTPWPEGRRIAGVSSFGLGGTNVHVVLEGAPEPTVARAEPEAPPAEREWKLLMLSAKTEAAAAALAGRYRDYLSANPRLELADVCATANARRSRFAHRLSIVARSREQLLAQLDGVAGGSLGAGVRRDVVAGGDAPAEVAFLFTGQGAQYPGMGRQLYAREPIFRQALDRCAQLLR
ncbi:MAG: type I polyketide synthase, partial [Chloroflexales bacterium]|nr:type I polyketide synthase [Chloroflexales bacterium]